MYGCAAGFGVETDGFGAGAGAAGSTADGACPGSIGGGSLLELGVEWVRPDWLWGLLTALDTLLHDWVRLFESVARHFAVAVCDGCSKRPRLQ